MNTHKLTYTQSDIHTHAPAHNKHTRIGNNRQSKTQTHKNTQSLITRHKAGMDDCRQMHGNLFLLPEFGKFA